MTIKLGFFDYVETHSDGTPIPTSRERLTYRALRVKLALLFPGKIEQARLRHLLALSASAPHHPVDLTVFEPPQPTCVPGIVSERLKWSARVWFQGADPAPGKDAVVSAAS